MFVDEFIDLRAEISDEFPEQVVAVLSSSPHEIRDAEGALLSSLLVKASAAAGDLALELETTGGAQISGSIPYGLELTVGSLTLAVAQDARAEGRSIRVALTAALSTPISAGATIVLAASADFDLGQAINQPADAARVPLDAIAPPGGELLLEARRVPPGLALRPGSVLLLSAERQPYAGPEAWAIADPSSAARRVPIVAPPQQIGGVLSILHGAAR